MTRYLGLFAVGLLTGYLWGLCDSFDATSIGGRPAWTFQQTR